MVLSRARALAILGAAAVVPGCSGTSIRVGSKNFTESFVLAEIYAQTLENAGLRVTRRFNLGSTQIAMAALQRGDIDLYPEYTGTGLIDVLHLPAQRDASAIYATVIREFAARYNLVWLKPAPMNDSQALATTQAVAQRLQVTTLSQLASVASQLRLATIAEFLQRPDGLPGLQKVYGGFHFKEVRSYDIGLKYDALLRDEADVATAFTTDGAIGADNLVVFIDDKHLWPPYNPAPVVRADTLKKFPRIAPALNGVTAFITDGAARELNYAVEHDKKDPADVAAQFLKDHRV